MTHMITAECINCTACATDCPTEAISPGAAQYIINPNVCTDCEGLYSVPKCFQVCPVGGLVSGPGSTVTVRRSLEPQSCQPPPSGVPHRSLPLL